MTPASSGSLPASQQLTLACGTCRSPAGQPCVSLVSGNATKTHVRRLNDVYEHLARLHGPPPALEEQYDPRLDHHDVDDWLWHRRCETCLTYSDDRYRVLDKVVFESWQRVVVRHFRDDHNINYTPRTVDQPPTEAPE